MKELTLTTKIQEFESVSDLSDALARLVSAAMQATQKSYSPYSKFQVGAAVLLNNGEVVNGSNQENAAYPSGLCAERVALFYANATYPDVPVEAVAIASARGGVLNAEPIPPCGACLQVLKEAENRFAHPIKIIMAGANRIWVVESVSHLLPLSFLLK